MSANCKSCGRIMIKSEDFSGGDIESLYCSSCTNADGSLKSLDEITLHIANQLIMSQGIDREAATKAARSILSVQPEWNNKIKRIDNGKLYKTKALIIFLTVSLVLSMSTIVLLFFRNNGDNLFTTRWESADYIEFSSNKLTKSRIMKPGDQFRPVFDFSRKMLVACDGGENSYIYAEFLNTRSHIRGHVSVTQVPEFFEFISIFTPRNALYKNFYVVLSDNRTKLVCLKNNKNIYISDINDKNDVIYSSNLVIWIQTNKLYPQYDTVMSFNIQSGMISPIDDSPTKKKCIKANDNQVFWIDTNPIRNLKTIKGYNIHTNEPIETPIEIKDVDIIDTNNCFIALRSIENQNWMGTQGKLIFIEQNPYNKAKGFNPQYLLQIYDLKSHKMQSIKMEDHMENLSLENPQIIVASVNRIIENKLLFFEEYVAYKSIREGKPGITVINVNQMGGKSKFIETIINSEIIGIYDNWIFYSYQKNPSMKDEFNLIAENLVSGTKIEIGEYMIKKDHHFDLAYSDGFIAWSALSQDTGYDIFYTRLP